MHISWRERNPSTGTFPETRIGATPFAGCRADWECRHATVEHTRSVRRCAALWLLAYLMPFSLLGPLGGRFRVSSQNFRPESNFGLPREAGHHIARRDYSLRFRRLLRLARQRRVTSSDQLCIRTPHGRQGGPFRSGLPPRRLAWRRDQDY